MRRKLILTTGVLAAAGAVALGTAGAASAKVGYDLKANHKTVHRHAAVGFRMDAVSDSAGEHLKGLRFCLQETSLKAGKYKTVKCTTVSHWDRKAKAQVYSIGYRFGSQPKGTYAFRGIVQTQHHHQWTHSYKTNTVLVHVK